MPQKNKKSTGKEDKEFVSIIYNKKNDSPKYFELKKSKILLFVIGLPTITLLALIIGGIGLVHTSPFHLIDNYRQNQQTREAESKANTLINQVQKIEEEKKNLASKVSELEAKLVENQATPQTGSTTNEKCPQAPACPSAGSTAPSATVSSIGLSTLSFFRPIQGQHDKTRPATLNLSGFKVSSTRDTTNLQFNIIPATGDEGSKLSGHIIVIMKNELAIEVYPQQALSGLNTQINYSSGEPFSTQRFRPVEASFLNPKKSGNYTFTVFIFARNGDLLHYQSVILPVKL